MKRPEDDKEFMEVVGHLISHPRFQKLDGMPRAQLEVVSYMTFSIMIGE